MRRGHPQTDTSLFFCLRAAPPLSSPLDLNSTLRRRAAPSSSLLRRRRALDGEALPDLLHRTCGSTVERSYVRSSFEGLLDLFVGRYTDQICLRDCTVSIFPNSPSTSSAARELPFERLLR